MTSAAHGQFIYANVGCVPGAAHDSWAWSQDSLCDKLRKPDEPWAGYLMARGLHLIGDDAYACGHTHSAAASDGLFSRKGPDHQWLN